MGFCVSGIVCGDEDVRRFKVQGRLDMICKHTHTQREYVF